LAELAPSGTLERWLPSLRRITESCARLFCFPYAGGSATVFASWPERLPGVDIRPVQLPGRGNRLHEAPISGWQAIVHGLAPALPPLLDRPFAFFGHSMGALLAFEMTRFLRRQGHRLPAHLFVSGCRAPHIPDADRISPDLPEEAFRARLRALGGTPPEVLGDRELMALFMPALRADFAVCATYECRTEPPLPCPITVFGGRDDEESTPEQLEEWQAHTTEILRIREFPGGHFFLQDNEDLLLADVGETLRNAAAALSQG
jgi:medium-chain acyl-[acyl-carrier-protein] hydrolase